MGGLNRPQRDFPPSIGNRTAPGAALPPLPMPGWWNSIIGKATTDPYRVPDPGYAMPGTRLVGPPAPGSPGWIRIGGETPEQLKQREAQAFLDQYWTVYGEPQSQELGIDRQYYGDVYNAQEGYGNQQRGFLGQTRDIDLEKAANARNLANQLLGFSDRDIANQIGQINTKTATTRREYAGDVAARGASSAAGTGAGYQDITTNQQQQTEAANIGYGRQQADLHNQLLSIGLNEREIQLAYEQGAARLNLDAQLRQLDKQYKQGKLDREGIALRDKIRLEAMKAFAQQQAYK